MNILIKKKEKALLDPTAKRALKTGDCRDTLVLVCNIQSDIDT